MSNETITPEELKQKYGRIWNKRKIYALLILLNFIILSSVVIFKVTYHSPEIVINQVGFLPESPKSFMIKSDYTLYHGSFDLISDNEEIVLEKEPLEYLGKLWGSHYYKGDFSGVNTSGNYKIRANYGNNDLTSSQFVISEEVYDLSLERAYEFFYYQRANTEVSELVSGYSGHALDHLDDGYEYEDQRFDLYGGWSSSGSYSKSIENGTQIFGVIYSCLQAYQLRPDFYDTLDLYDTEGNLGAGDVGSNGIPDILDEAMWGILYAEKLILPNGSIIGSIESNGDYTAPEYDTDQINQTSDDRKPNLDHEFASASECMWLVAGFAKFCNIINSTGYFAEKNSSLIALANDIYAIYDNAFNQTISTHNPVEISAYLAASHNLYINTGNETYMSNAEWAVQNIANNLENATINTDLLGLDDRALIIIAEWAMDVNTPASWLLAKQIFQNRWNNVWSVSSSDAINFYQLVKVYNLDQDIAGWTFFSSKLGLNTLYLNTVCALLIGDYLLGGSIPLMKEMAYNLIDWIYGKNPSQICMIEGLGEINLPTYHHRYMYCDENPRGAVPGAIPNGYFNQKSQPYMDLDSAELGSIGVLNIDSRSNEPGLSQNIAFLMALTYATVNFD